ncbi:MULTISPECIES: zinc-binding dehydrogenase [Streptomyces]|uniref:zinc-binding dehydrogenase n=1 Tax=Streptomyces TaxID=1883 RepID=UPI000A6E916F
MFRRAVTTKTVVSDRHLVALPPGVGAGEALAVLVQGLTAWHLLRSVARIRPGESVVVHAAAGGTGSLAVQLAREFGAGRIIATASSVQKRALALELGADAAIGGDAAATGSGFSTPTTDARPTSSWTPSAVPSSTPPWTPSGPSAGW